MAETTRQDKEVIAHQPPKDEPVEVEVREKNPDEVSGHEDFAQAAYESAALDFLISERRVATNDLAKSDATVAAVVRQQQAVKDAHLDVGPQTQGVRDDARQVEEDRQAEAKRGDEIHAERLANLEKARKAKAAEAKKAEAKPSKEEVKAANEGEDSKRGK